jgi:hypothetical protein
VHLQPASATPTLTSRYAQDPSTRVQAASNTPPQFTQQETALTDRAAVLASGAHRQNNGNSFGDEAEALSPATTPRPQYLSRITTSEKSQRPFEAPEVVSMDFEGMHPVSPLPDQYPEKYPAFRTQADYAELLLSLPAGMDNIWMPLKRPAMHNRYHGFCKGAWEIRKAVRSCPQR